MPVYAYTGVDEKGRTVRGSVDADSVKAARQALRRKGIFLDEAKPLADRGTSGRKPSAAASGGGGAATAAAASPAGGGQPIAPTFARAGKSIKRLVSNNTQAVAQATRQLATLLHAGIPLPEALAALTDQLDNEGLREAFVQVADRVREGVAFARALDEHKRYFPNLYVSMVSAGEASGTLEAVLARLADFTEGQVKLRNKVFGALAYPAFMVFFGIVIVSVLMVVVVPKVTAIFDDFRRALPWYTSMLIGVSRFFGSFWWLVLIVIALAVYGFARWKRTPEGAFKWDAFVLRTPIFGELERMVAISRFTRTLGTLLRSGVPLLKAMDIVKFVLGNKVLEAVVTEAANSIKEGESIAEPLKRSGKFPPMVTHMIAVGERSGELEGMLESVANSYDTTIDSRVGMITSLLEPIIIMFIGGSAGTIAFAILMPLLQLNEFVQ
jgi:general secretion pathway protein F